MLQHQMPEEFKINSVNKTASDKIVLTAEMIDHATSSNGGLSYEQLQLLGVEIPPKKGWKRRLVGTLFLRSTVDQFMDLKNAHLNA